MCRFDPAFESLSPNPREAVPARDPVDWSGADATLTEYTEHAKVGSIPTWRQNMLEWHVMLSRIRRPEASLDAWPFSAPDPAGLISNNPILAPPQKSSEYLRSIAICGIRRISMNFVRHSLHVPTKSALWLCKQIDVDQNNKDALSRKTLQYN